MSPSTSEPSPQNSSEEEGQEDPLDLVLEELLKELSPQSSAPTASHGNDEVSSHGNDEVSFTIRFSLSTFETLKDMSGGGSIAETLRDAIALSKWFTDTLKTGSKIYVKRNGKMHEVVKI